MTKGKNPMKNLRGRMKFTHNESYNQPDDASPANPWDRMLQQDDRWRPKGPLRMMKADFLTVVVLFGVAALVIGAVLLLK